MLTACGERDQGHTAQLVLLAVLLKEVAGVDKTVAAVAESLFTGEAGGVWGVKLGGEAGMVGHISGVVWGLC